MSRPLAPDVFTWPDEDVHLIGSKCTTCEAVVFPRQSHCPRCSRAGMGDALLPRQGTIVAWTTQGFAPGPPYAGPSGEDFEPFGIGLVQLGDVVRVEGRLTESDPAKLRVGMNVELTTVPLTVDVNGEDVLTFAFRPVLEEGVA